MHRTPPCFAVDRSRVTSIGIDMVKNTPHMIGFNRPQPDERHCSKSIATIGRDAVELRSLRN